MIVKVWTILVLKTPVTTLQNPHFLQIVTPSLARAFGIFPSAQRCLYAQTDFKTRYFLSNF